MPGTIAMKGNSVMDKKIVSISSKRQITIPQKFFTMLGFSDEAEFILRGNELVIRPARQNNGGEFAEHILKELIEAGLSGEELLNAFKVKQAQIRPAIESMLQDAHDVAQGIGEYSTYDEIFSAEDEV